MGRGGWKEYLCPSLNIQNFGHILMEESQNMFSQHTYMPLVTYTAEAVEGYRIACVYMDTGEATIEKT